MATRSFPFGKLAFLPVSRRGRRSQPSASRRFFLETLEERRLLATVVTDKLDYAPAETAIITASDFQRGEAITFQVLHNDGTPNTGGGHEPWTVIDGSDADLDGRRDGNVTTSWYVDPDDSLNSSFTLTALGLFSGLSASTTFTDAGPPSVDQLFQWDPPSWVTGNNDGPYFEGDFVPYYTSLSNLVPGDTYQLAIEWDTTKGGKHALDYIGTFDASVTPVDPAVEAGITVNTTDTIAIPVDPNITADPTFVGTQQAGVIKIYNGDLTAISGYTLIGTYADDSSTRIVVTFVAQDDGGDPDTTKVVLTWSGHIAARQNWGTDSSAVDIPGSPYHMRLQGFFDVTNNDQLNVGNTDRSLSAEAVIFPAIITIIKDAVPDDGQDFAFTTTGTGLANFTLDDDGANANPLDNSITFSVTDFGAKTVTEAAVAGWALSAIEITEMGGTANSTFDLATRTATLNVQEGETITVKFTNNQQARIIIEKQTLPDGSSQSFEFDPSWSGSNFFLTDGQQNDSGFLAPGTYSIAEVNLPAGWTLSSAVCSDGSPINAISLQAGETVTCVFTNTQSGRIIVEKQTLPDGSTQAFEFDPSYSTNFFLTDGQQNSSGFLAPGAYSVAEVNIPAGWTLSSAVCSDGSPASAISLQPGEVVTCVFTNTQQGQIIVEKQTLPDDSTQAFEFDPSYSTNFFLTDGQQNSSGFLAPGTYSVAEVNIPAGWTLSSAVCSDGSPASAISLQPGEVVTCVFTNTQQSQIIVEKQTLPDGSTQAFEFDPSYSTNFFLTDGQQNSSGFLAPGTYSVAEVNIPAGWTLSSAVCSDGSPASAISLQPGEVVTCVFTNTQQGQIIVEKQTLPDGSTQQFEFDPSYGANFFLTDGQQNSSGFLAPGTYSVAEIVPAGWQLTSAVCSDGSSVNAISLQPGEVVTCVFTNTQQSQIIVEKQTLPDGSAQPFEFDPSYSTNFFLTDGQQNSSGFLAPGIYSVAEVNIPAGWNLTSAVCSDGSPVGAISLAPGEVVTCVFTNTQNGSIAWEKRDHENALQGGATFEITPNPFTGSGSLIVTDNLGPDADADGGQFLILNVLPGEYTITETLSPPGFTIDPDPTRVIAVAPGESASVGIPDQNDPYLGDGNESDFHNVPILGAKSGTKFEDHNGNGIRDLGDQGLPGWVIFVDYNDDGLLSAGEPSAVTDALGNYTISGINLGTWKTREVLQVGWTATFPLASDAFGRFHEETFTPASVFVGNDFGNFHNISISGQKFHDLSGDGIKDIGEPGLLGWVIQLDIGADGSVDATTTTDILGNYSFTNLGPGVYRVREVQQTGWIQTTPNPADIVAASGLNVTGVDFGNFRAGEIIVIGPDKSPTAPAPVLVVDKDTGTILTSFLAYEPTFVGGTRVATGDLTGDGIDEIITAPGRGRAPEIRVFTQAGVELPQFRTMAYAATFTGGVHVAVGDVNGDGLNDIVTVPSYGKAQVKVFLNQTPNADPIANAPFKSFYAFPTTFVGGAFVRVADMGLRLPSGAFTNSLDGKAEIVVGSGPGIKAAVKVFHVNGTPTAVRTVFPFSTASTAYKNGVNLDVARLNGDLIPDIIVGAENGGNSRIETFVWNGSAALVKTGTFTAYGDSASKTAPVRVAALDGGGDGIADSLATVQGPGGTTQQIRCFDIVSPSPLVVTQTAALSGFAGPYWIAALDTPTVSQEPVEAEGEADFEAAALSVASTTNFDVSGDGALTAQDALLVVNGLNTQSSGVTLTSDQVKTLDVSGDGQLTALDALLLVNELNRAASAVAALAPALSSTTSSRETSDSQYLADVDALFAELA